MHKINNTNKLMKNTGPANNLSKLFNSAAISTIGLSSIITAQDIYPQQSKYEHDIDTNKSSRKEITLLHFMRLYKLGDIPVMDFIMIYIIFFVFNNLYFNIDYKIILIGSIPFTILFNMISVFCENKLGSHKKKHITSKISLFIMILCIGYILLHYMHEDDY
jgi:hypothetical protein